MAIMLSSLYDALRAANVPEDKARAAAVEAAEFHNAVTDIKSTQRLHTWMFGGIYAVLVPSLWLLLRVAAKVGALG